MSEELTAEELGKVEAEELTPEQKLAVANVVATEKGRVLFEACHLTVKDKHIVAECDSIEASQELALLLVEDVFIRVKPLKVEAKAETEPDPKE
ncbi:hypothetical protein ES703_120953 [subsurface metagenome]